MCFSATASFTASGVLTVVGFATLRKIKNKKDLPVALVPLIFAVQQFIEGLIWLNFDGVSVGSSVILINSYLFFALFFWPMYGPGAVLALETKPRRKTILRFLWAGGIIAGFLGLISIIKNPATAVLFHNHIVYNVVWWYKSPITILYGLATVGAGLISSQKFIKIFGAVAGVAAVISTGWYFYSFDSTWCFFAALLSLFVYFHFVSVSKEIKKIIKM